MKTNKKLMLFAAMTAIISAASFAVGTPEVSDVTMSQTTRNIVTITYRLANGPAVVTLDIETNCVVNGETRWASIGGESIQNFKPGSDVFKKVGGKDIYTIKWLPDLSWADHRIPDGGARAILLFHQLPSGRASRQRRLSCFENRDAQDHGEKRQVDDGQHQ